MKNKLILISVVLVALMFCIGSVGAVSDLTPPRLPCEYYGTVTIDGVSAPINTVITAKIGTDIAGTYIVSNSGLYGNLMVQNNFGPEDNPVVTFYINGIKAYQTSVFSAGDVFRIDLSTTGVIVVPTVTPTVVPTPVPTVVPDPTDPTTSKVIGKIKGLPPVAEKSVTITPPELFIWNLDLSNPLNNAITIGDVHATANCNYVLSIAGSTGGYMIGESGAAMTFPTLKNPVLVYNGEEYLPIERFVNGSKATSLPIYIGSSGIVDIPIKLQQILVPADADKNDPTIVFTYMVETL